MHYRLLPDRKRTVQFLLELELDVNFRCWLTPEISWRADLQDAQLQHVAASWPVVKPMVDLAFQVRTRSPAAQRSA